MCIADVIRVHNLDVDLPIKFHAIIDAISLVLVFAYQTVLELLPITSAWLPQCHPSPKTSCVEVLKGAQTMKYKL